MEPFLPDHKIFFNRDGIIVVRARIERREPVCQPDEAIKDWRDYIFFYSSSFPPLFFGRISIYIFFVSVSFKYSSLFYYRENAGRTGKCFMI